MTTDQQRNQFIQQYISNISNRITYDSDFIRNNATTLHQLLSVDDDRTTTSNFTTNYLQTCKLLRLLATKSEDYREQIRETGILSRFISLIHFFITQQQQEANKISNNNNEEDMLFDKLPNCLSLTWNVILNSITGHVNNVIHIIQHDHHHKSLFNELACDSIDLFFDDRRVIQMVVMTLYNSLAQKPSLCTTTDSSTAIINQLENQMMNNQRLLLLLLESYEGGLKNDVTSEYILLIWNRLLNHFCLSPKCDNDAGEGVRNDKTMMSSWFNQFLKEQLLRQQLIGKSKMNSTLHFIQILHVYARSQTIEKEEKELLQLHNTVQHTFVLTQIAHFALMVATTIFDKVFPSSGEQQASQTSTVDGIQTRSHMLKYVEFETLFLCLEILANITSLGRELIQGEMSEQGLVPFVLTLFNKCPPPVPKMPSDSSTLASKQEETEEAYLVASVEGSSTQVFVNRRILNQTGIPVIYHIMNSDDDSDGEDSTFDVMPLGYRSHLLRILGNMCFNSKSNQDLVRTLNGIPLVLNHCYTDDENPYLREYGVFCIRNLTENNSENQELISKFQAMQVDPRTNSMLNEMGVDAEVETDGLTSKLKISQLPKGE